jgi:hypothetical protein
VRDSNDRGHDGLVVHLNGLQPHVRLHARVLSSLPCSLRVGRSGGCDSRTLSISRIGARPSRGRCDSPGNTRPAAPQAYCRQTSRLSSSLACQSPVTAVCGFRGGGCPHRYDVRPCRQHGLRELSPQMLSRSRGPDCRGGPPSEGAHQGPRNRSHTETSHNSMPHRGRAPGDSRTRC